MQKGLSKLQKKILKMAQREQGRILPRDVLVEFYGFPVEVEPNSVRSGCLVFNRRAIGLKRYKAASVSVCKAFNRLTDRGLTEREDYNGVALTDEGQRVARALGKR